MIDAMHEGKATMRWTMVMMVCLLTALPASAQVSRTRGDQDNASLPDQQQQSPLPPMQPQAPIRPVDPGRVAGSAVGVAGQRQSREQVAPDVVPMARISSRIQNRVQSRLRNRIDRDYDPQANAISPFAVAAEEARTTGRTR